MARTHRRFSLLLLLALLLSALPLAQPARAATTWTVSKPDDTNDGVCNADCSLREALTVAQSGDTIQFGNGAATWTIQLNSALGALPALTRGGITINGGAGRNVIIDGSAAGSAFGLRIASANNIIRGLVIINFSSGLEATGGSGILISGATATGNQVYGCLIGVRPDGTAAGNQFNGILLDNGASSNIIGGTGTNEPNVIAGNLRADITLAVTAGVGSLVSNNRVVGNLIGTNPGGTAAVNPVSTGVEGGVILGTYARNNIIGPGNTIGGYRTNPQAAGVALYSNITGDQNAAPTGNRIIGNRIGTNLAGSAAIANTTGIRLTGPGDGPIDTTIGGETAADRNIIAGNDGAGILISNNNGVINTQIIGNYIGLNASGAVLGNGGPGLFIERNDSSNPLARVIVGPGNVISGNGGSSTAGVRIETSNNVVRGNFIGTNTAGSLAGAVTSGGFGNGGANIEVRAGTGNLIGGPSPADRNVLGVGRLSEGIYLNTPSSGTTVQGNYIGINAAGNGALHSDSTTTINSTIGVSVQNSAGNLLLNNVISALGYGISLQGASNNNQIRGNRIGTDSNGDYAIVGLGHRSDGIHVIGGSGNVIGGANLADRNIIARSGRRSLAGDLDINWFHGIRFQGPAAANNRVEGNLLAQNGASGNGSGVFVRNTTGITIARTETTGNQRDGIQLHANSGETVGNNNRAAPTGLAVGLVSGQPTLSGTTNCGAGCTIEVFTSATQENGEGPEYVTRLSPTAGNNFSVTLPSCRRWLTATVTDAAGNTSPFAPMVDGNGQGCPPPAAEPNVSLTAADPNSRTILPGATAIYTHTLTNTGNASGNFSIQRTSTQTGWSFQVNPTSVTLGAGQSTQVIVTVNAPAGTGGLSDQTTIRASVATSTSTLQSEPRTNTTTVTRIFGVEITPDNSGTVTPGPNPVTIDYTHTIRNTGNGTDSITLSASSTAPSVSTTFPDGNSCANLAAGATCTRRVRVTVAANSTDTFDTTTVRATASNGTTFDAATNTTTIRQSAVPQITPATQTRDALPTSSESFAYTVTNIGQVAGVFTVTLPTVPAGWTVTLNPAAPASFTLTPGASRMVTVTMQMPTTPIPDANSTHTAQIRVDSSDGGFATATATTRVLLRPAFTFSPATVPTLNGVAPGATVVFTHTLTNTGNGADTFTIAVAPSGGLTLLDVTPASPISLNRNASATVVVRARVNSGASAGVQTLDVTASTASTPQPAPITRTNTVNVVAAAFPQLSPAQTRDANPGQSVAFEHTLTNVGNQAAVFTLSASTPTGWGAAQIVNSTCPVGPATLGVGAVCQFGVQVTVPPGTPAGLYPDVRITATADGNSASVVDTVRVGAVAGLEFTPNYTGSSRGNADPGQTVTYTHTLTNTGNATDSYSLTLTLPSAAISQGWSAVVSPTQLANVPRNTSRNVQVRVRAPTGVVAGAIGTVTVTATSALAPAVQRSVIAETVLNGIDGAELLPAEQTKSANPTEALADTVTFFHTLRNSGSTVISYTLSAGDDLGWATIVSPTVVGPLLPNQTAPISVSVTAPAGTATGVRNLATVQVRALANPAALLAEAQNTTIVGPQFAVLLDPPVNRGTALPGATVAYTHTLTNIGSNSDIFELLTIPGLGWDTTVTPPFANLGPGASQVITVTVRVPTSVLSGTLDIATVIARSTANPALSASAEERTTILQVAGADLSPPLFTTITPNTSLTLVHTLVNTGNGLDTFTLEATDQQNWDVTISPASVTLRAGRSFSSVVVTVQTPANLAPNVVNTITVRAVSRRNPAVVARVLDVLSYPQLQDDPPPANRTYLPLVFR